MRKLFPFIFATIALGAPISLVNHGFETGTTTGWVTTGNVFNSSSTTVTTFDNTVWDVGPAGMSMAAMNSAGAGAPSLDGFFGIPAGTLQSLNTNFTLTNGAGIYQDFTGNAGDTVTMYWDYVARDYIPFNDPAFAVVVNPDGTVHAQTLASIHSGGMTVGTSGHSTWQEFTFTLTQSGNHRIGFAATNDSDTILNNALFLDNEEGTSSATPGLTPSFPLLPNTSGGGTFVFIDPQPGFWYDPPFAESYMYVLLGGAMFTEFSTPPAQFGFGVLTFTGGGQTFQVNPGVLTDISGLGISKFTISGIPDGAIDFQDPNFATAFPAFLDWVGTASGLNISITPHGGQLVPEPSTYGLMAVGLFGLGLMRRRRHPKGTA